MVCFIHILVYRYTIYMVYHKICILYTYIVYHIQISTDFLFEGVCVYVCTHVHVCVDKYAVEDRGQPQVFFSGTSYMSIENWP